jgi:hypothetical protein
MSGFDQESFEGLMDEAARIRSLGRYGDALEVRRAARFMTPQGSSELGRALRDDAADYDHLGWYDEADECATRAFNIHDLIVSTMIEPTRAAYRERAASEMYVGVNGLRRAIKAMREDRQPVSAPKALDFMRRTWSDLHKSGAQASGINRFVDQYKVNASRRVSVAESLAGSRVKGLIIGIVAVGLSPMSESLRIDTHNPALSRGERLRAKRNALLGGVAAIGVGMFATQKHGRRQDLTLRLIDRAL